jgi:uncharacterized protein (DUF3820 family)
MENSLENQSGKTGDPLNQQSDRAYFLKLACTKMPFGKYAGTLLVDLPEHYVVWYYRKGFPNGELGTMLKEIYEIKVNGLEYLFAPFKNK